MMYLKEIIALFYFGYWIYRDTQPFSFWWLVLLFGGIYLLEILIGSLIKGSTEVMKREGENIIGDFNERLIKLETQIHGNQHVKSGGKK